MAIVIGEWDLQPAPPQGQSPAPPPTAQPQAAKPTKPHHVELGLRQLKQRSARVRAH